LKKRTLAEACKVQATQRDYTAVTSRSLDEFKNLFFRGKKVSLFPLAG
jgi:hypothetical protein